MCKMNVVELPEKPEKPLDSDCCGNGCTPCVLDIYQQELKIWELECLKLQKGNLNKEDAESNDDDIEDISLSEIEYRKFRIVSVTKETNNTFRYRVGLPRSKSLGLKLGQHILIRGRINGVPVTRQYTPVSDVAVTGYFDLLIKIYPYGKMSQIIKQWTEQDFIDVRGPFGNFDYSRNKYDTVYMLAVGTGVAPMAQIIQGILGDEDEETRVRLIYGCSTYDDILMKKELDVWSDFWNFSVLYALTQQDEHNRCYRYGDKVHHGRISQSLLDEELNDKINNNIFVLVCGTKEFETDMISHLTDMGLSENKYFRF